ncbi:hypothetical protein RUND412_007440 [Rhizina undulata]
MSNSENSFQPNAELDSDAEEDYVFIDADFTLGINSSVKDLSQRTQRDPEPVVNNAEQTINQGSAEAGYIRNYVPLPRGFMSAIYSYTRPIFINQDAVSDSSTLELHDDSDIETWDFDISAPSANVMNLVSSAYENTLQTAETTAEDEECTLCCKRKAIVQCGQCDKRHMHGACYTGEVRTVEIASRSRPPREALVSELGKNFVLS